MAYDLIKTDSNTAELRVTSWVDLVANDGDGKATLDALTAMIAGLPARINRIDVRLNCVGGVSFVALGLVDFLRSRFHVITSTIENIAMSAGATIAQAGHVRRIAADGVCLIHPTILHVRGYDRFTASRLRELANTLDDQTEKSERLYVERSGRNGTDIRAVYERVLNAQESLEAGLVDEIIEARAPLPMKDITQDWWDENGRDIEAALARRSVVV
jgi:ATP-dependent protease ClpP protease subunit